MNSKDAWSVTGVPLNQRLDITRQGAPRSTPEIPTIVQHSVNPAKLTAERLILTMLDYAFLAKEIVEPNASMGWSVVMAQELFVNLQHQICKNRTFALGKYMYYILVASKI